MHKDITTDIERFNSSYAVNTDTGCHEWIYSLNGRGYGQFSFHAGTGEKMSRTVSHRWIYQHIHGPLPSSVYVCHKCDNRKCVNPDHLFAGTAKDNVQDMIAKGRRVISSGDKTRKPGEQNGRAKLTWEDVEQIRNSSLSTSQAAKLYKVSAPNITAIRLFRSWKPVDKQANASSISPQ